MNLSWFDNSNASLATDLVEEQTLFNGASLSDIDDAKLASKILWVRNNGSETASEGLVDFGFYISSAKLDDLNKVLKLGQTSNDNNLPYGLFVVFGYENADGTNSYIDKFLDDSMSRTELLKFQVNWNQGCSPLNKIKLNQAYTKRQSGYVKNSTFPIYFATSENTYYESVGKIKVAVGLRCRNGTILISDFDLHAHASNENYA